MESSLVNEPLLTIPEVARILRMHPDRCYQMAAANELPVIRLSKRRIRIPRATLEKWIEMQAERALSAVEDDGA